MNAAAHLSLLILQGFAGPYYVASTDTQRKRVLQEAEKVVALELVKLLAEAQDAGI